MSHCFSLAAIWLLLVCLAPAQGDAQDWTTYRRDFFRSGNILADESPVRLTSQWSWQSPLPPEPAWDGPARWDAYNLIRDLPAMRQYDACFHPVSDGELLLFGSSSQDAVVALDLESGDRKWAFVAGGPVRLAPTIEGQQVLFGCDDGFVYCLDKAEGTLIWKFSPGQSEGAEQRLVINNDRLISYYPIRTGVVVRDGIAYFGASFLPWRESYLCGVDAKTGEVGREGTFITTHASATLEGNLLIAQDKLIVPQGRVAPLLFDRTTGAKIGSLPGGGGVTIVLTEAGDIVRTEGGRPARAGHVGVYRGKEQLAAFPRGRAMVVGAGEFYVIDGEKLFAASRMTNELRWSRAVDEPLELIKVGETLFVGGRDHVTAVNARDGEVLWSAEVAGRAFGLIFANNTLIVSTDQGALHAFRTSQRKKLDQLADNSEAATQVDENWDSPDVPRVRKQNLLHRWVFHRSAMQDQGQAAAEKIRFSKVVVKDQAGELPLTANGQTVALKVGESKEVEALKLDGSFFPLPSQSISSLPRDAISVEAWVRVDEPQQWGSICGCIQDDGSTEHGWLLGYQSDRFAMAIAGGGNGITYLSAEKPFEPGTWNHVVGTYDGSETRLFVNGTLAATTSGEQGPISYSDKCFFTVGCYHDSDETYPLKGALQEVCIYAKPLTATEIVHRFDAIAAEFGTRRGQMGESKSEEARSFAGDDIFDWGPYTRFVRPGVVEIQYGTEQATASVVDLITESGVRRIVDPEPVRQHWVQIDQLPHKRELQYQIRDSESETARRSITFALDTHFDWATRTSSIDATEPWVDQLIGQAPNPRGLAVVVGSEQSERAEALAQGSDLHVVLVEPDAKQAEQLRRRWFADPRFDYGKQFCVVNLPLEQLPAAFASCVIAENATNQIRRLVRPAGGVLSDGQAVTWRRKAIPGSGQWSHMYGTADNSAFGGEELSDISEREQLTTQWIGRPGPRYQTDRQNRKPSPLAAGGRLFLQGQQRMIALDNFSGAVLWSVESPTVMRWNVPHDCANWCCDDEGVYVAAEDQAWLIDGRDGDLKRRYALPQSGPNKGQHWGYIARYQDDLLGTSVKPKAVYSVWWGPSQWFDSTGGEDTHVVAGDQLFSLNAQTGDVNWTYDGLILHPTITVLDDHVYFVESKTKAQLEADSRRLSLDADQQHELVCLKLSDGQIAWRHQLPPFAGHLSSFYLAGGGDQEHRTLLTVASEATLSSFRVHAFDPQSGEEKWDQSIAWEANHHGKHISRPAIQGDLVYIRPEVLKLADGESIRRGFPGGHGCASYTATTNGIFSRLGETTWWDVRTDKVNRFDRIRTDCWISVIPAQGMVLSAEGGGGCSCGSWLETSMGFLPRTVDDEMPEQE